MVWRKFHYWRPSGRTETPANVLVFDTETTPDKYPGRPDVQWHRLRLGCALAYRLERGRRTRVRELTFRTAAEFWGLVESRLDPRRPLWLVAHNTPFDLGVVSGWDWLEARGEVYDRVILEPTITYIRGRLCRGTLVVADTLNWYHCSLSVIGESVGVPKLHMPSFADGDRVWEEYCRRDVYVTAAALDALVAFHREHDLGPWRPTIASLAFSCLRSRHLRHRVLVHTHARSLALERGSYYGGRVDTPYLGVVPASPVYECDYTSLYPSTYTSPLPVRLLDFQENPTAAAADYSIRHHLCCADVTLRSERVPYPLRVGDRVYHVTGDLRTRLASPELRQALDHGHVRQVHELSVHHGEPVFADYLEHFGSLKCRYEYEGNPAFRNICKLLLNGLYGKTGQTSPRWVEVGERALRILELENGLEPGSIDPLYARPMHDGCYHSERFIPGIPTPVQCRCTLGVEEYQVRRDEAPESVPAIAATVTSHGRRKLTDAQYAAGAGHWYYSDTDSVWVDETGLAGLKAAGLIGGGEVGRLAVAGARGRLVVHGRKDYEYDDSRKLKGVRRGVTPDEHGLYHQLHFPSARSQLERRLVEGVLVEMATKEIHRVVDWCVPSTSGWTRPLRSPEEIPEKITAGGLFKY